MSEEPLTCKFIYTPKEYGHAMQCYWQNSRMKWLLVVLLFPLGMQVYAEIFPEPGTPPVTFLSVILDFVPAVIVLIFLGLLLKFAGQFYFRRTAHCNQKMLYTLHESGVHVETPYSNSEMKWPIYARAIENAHGFGLFHQGNRLFNWVSKSGFSISTDIDECRELLRRKIKDTRCLSTVDKTRTT